MFFTSLCVPTISRISPPPQKKNSNNTTTHTGGQQQEKEGGGEPASKRARFDPTAALSPEAQALLAQPAHQTEGAKGACVWMSGYNGWVGEWVRPSSLPLLRPSPTRSLTHNPKP